jgi:hypothetical protein
VGGGGGGGGGPGTVFAAFAFPGGLSQEPVRTGSWSDTLSADYHKHRSRQAFAKKKAWSLVVGRWALA